MNTILALLLPLYLYLSPLPSKIGNFRLNDLDNKSQSYAELKGKKVTVIDFWATWCKPCVRSIPKLVKLHEQYKSQGVQFIGVNVDGTRNLSKVKPAAHSLGITYPVLLDVNSQVMTELKVTQMPTILVVNEHDEIVALHQGYRPGEEELLQKEIEQLLQPEAKSKHEK
ncbi:MAG: TlpA disulfide reductase family protein [candidate division KSB1 bacterium]